VCEIKVTKNVIKLNYSNKILDAIFELIDETFDLFCIICQNHLRSTASKSDSGFKPFLKRKYYHKGNVAELVMIKIINNSKKVFLYLLVLTHYVEKESSKTTIFLIV